MQNHTADKTTITCHTAYNGEEFILFENALPRKNQKVIVTILDQFFNPSNEKPFRKYIGALKIADAENVVNTLFDCR